MHLYVLIPLLFIAGKPFPTPGAPYLLDSGTTQTECQTLASNLMPKAEEFGKVYTEALGEDVTAVLHVCRELDYVTMTTKRES